LRWKVEAKKSGHANKLKTLNASEDSDLGSTNKDDYEMVEVESQGCFMQVADEMSRASLTVAELSGKTSRSSTTN